jgi:hypothetical protein
MHKGNLKVNLFSWLEGVKDDHKSHSWRSTKQWVASLLLDLPRLDGLELADTEGGLWLTSALALLRVVQGFLLKRSMTLVLGGWTEPSWKAISPSPSLILMIDPATNELLA